MLIMGLYKKLVTWFSSKRIQRDAHEKSEKLGKLENNNSDKYLSSETRDIKIQNSVIHANDHVENNTENKTLTRKNHELKIYDNTNQKLNNLSDKKSTFEKCFSGDLSTVTENIDKLIIQDEKTELSDVNKLDEKGDSKQTVKSELINAKQKVCEKLRNRHERKERNDQHVKTENIPDYLEKELVLMKSGESNRKKKEKPENGVPKSESGRKTSEYKAELKQISSKENDDKIKPTKTTKKKEELDSDVPKLETGRKTYECKEDFIEISSKKKDDNIKPTKTTKKKEKLESGVPKLETGRKTYECKEDFIEISSKENDDIIKPTKTTKKKEETGRKTSEYKKELKEHSNKDKEDATESTKKVKKVKEVIVSRGGPWKVNLKTSSRTPYSRNQVNQNDCDPSAQFNNRNQYPSSFEYSPPEDVCHSPKEVFPTSGEEWLDCGLSGEQLLENLEDCAPNLTAKDYIDLYINMSVDSSAINNELSPPRPFPLENGSNQSEYLQLDPQDINTVPSYPSQQRPEFSNLNPQLISQQTFPRGMSPELPNPHLLDQQDFPVYNHQTLIPTTSDAMIPQLPSTSGIGEFSCISTIVSPTQTNPESHSMMSPSSTYHELDPFPDICSSKLITSYDQPEILTSGSMIPQLSPTYDFRAFSCGSTILSPPHSVPPSNLSSWLDSPDIPVEVAKPKIERIITTSKDFKLMVAEMQEAFRQGKCCKKLCGKERRFGTRLHSDQQTTIFRQKLAMHDSSFGWNFIFYLLSREDGNTLSYTKFKVICIQLMVQNPLYFIGNKGLGLLKMTVSLNRPDLVECTVDCVTKVLSVQEGLQAMQGRKHVFHENLSLLCAVNGDVMSDCLTALLVNDCPVPLFDVMACTEGMTGLHLAVEAHASHAKPALHTIHLLMKHAGLTLAHQEHKSGNTPLHLVAQSRTEDIQLLAALFVEESKPNQDRYSKLKNHAKESTRAILNSYRKSSQIPKNHKVLNFFTQTCRIAKTKELNNSS